MDKSPSINCQQYDDGSWDLDENDEEDLQHVLENLSSNSWDSSSEKGAGKVMSKDENEEADERPAEEPCENGDVKERTLSSDSWRSSGSHRRIIKAVEKPPFHSSDSSESLPGTEIEPVEDLEVLNAEPENTPDEEVDEEYIEPVPKFQGFLSQEESCVVEEIILSDVGGEEGLEKAPEPEEKTFFAGDVPRLKTNKHEQSLFVEDLEEPEEIELGEGPVMKKSETGSEDDATVWEIPVSDRLEYSDDNSVVPDTKRYVWKRSKSCRSLEKQSVLPGRSKSVGDRTAEVEFSLKDALVQYEGSRVKSVKEKKEEDVLSDILSMGDRPGHFQQIECRTLRTIIANVKKEGVDGLDGEGGRQENEQNEDCFRENCRSHVGPSSKVSEEAVSLPDMMEAGRSDGNDRRDFRRSASYTVNQNKAQENIPEESENNLTESWILLDEMGLSQTVTLTEVNILLNGKSADAVLQENKEHFIPKSTVVRNANSDFRVDQWNPLVEESLQHFLHEEDLGGEASASKSIGLERKFGNMLLYIQSGVNLTSSVRFIPVDIEMIHMWRQSRENVSPISSEEDARIALSENATEETSEYENHETSDEVYYRSPNSHRSGPAVRKRRTRQSKMDEDEHRMRENRSIIESLTDDIKQLKMRLDAERNRSSSLEQEIYRLRGQLDKCKSGQSSTDSQKNKSETAEDNNTLNDSNYIPQITSSSLLSIEDFRHENKPIKAKKSRAAPGNSNDDRSLYLDNDRKNFKDALDKNLNEIEEILKCNNQSEIGNDVGRSKMLEKTRRYQEENSLVSSSASVNTYAVVESASQVLSETTGSVDSWFKPSRSDGLQKNISNIINELEKENENLVMENMNLKKKLNEISVELDEYVSNCVMTSPVEERRQTESLRNQVCNLKLELEHLKSVNKNKEQSNKIKDAIIREELAEKSASLQEWRLSAQNMFTDLDKTRNKLEELGFSMPDLCLELAKLAPGELLSHIGSFVTQLMDKISDFGKENSILKNFLQNNFCYNSNTPALALERNFDVNYFQEIPNHPYGNLLQQGPNQSDKIALENEINNLRKENDLLLEYQIENNDKWKRETAALREERSKVEHQEKTLKILEIEKEELSQTLMAYQKERAILDSELQLVKNKAKELKIECEKRKMEVNELNEKFEEASMRFQNVDDSSTLKDEIINELKMSYNELESRERMQNNKLQTLSEQVKKLEAEKLDLEDELETTKNVAEESTNRMSEYITHLETMVSNSEENLANMKDKFNETSKSYAALKKSYEDLERENGFIVKKFNRVKEELDSRERLIKDLEESRKKTEEAKSKILADFNAVVRSEKEKMETLDKMLAERVSINDEISALKMRAETQAKMKDRLMKEQKDFMNEISILKKENNKLERKYRNVKAECNERTKLLKKLDGKLRDNFLMYNKRIACLEKNVSNIIEKAAAYKDTFLERRTEVKAVVRELQEQLDVACAEKKDLENEAANFYATLRHLQKEIKERNKMKRLSFMDEFGSNIPRGREDASDGSLSDSSNQMMNQLKQTESDLAEARERIAQLENSNEEDRNKYESIIADLKSQISKYQVRLELMLKNIATYGKNPQGTLDKKEEEEAGPKISSMEQKIVELTEELDKKRKRMLELTELIEGNEAEMKRRGDECETLREKVLLLKDEIKNMKNQFSKLQEFLSIVNKNVEMYQKERDEVSAKLAKSLKVIVEERASKQSSETVFAEKEKLFKDQIDQLQARLEEKKSDYEQLLKSMEEKKVLINRLQEDVKKWKAEVGILKVQVTGMKDRDPGRNSQENGEEGGNKQKNYSPSELKDVRAMNLELRKKEGALEAKIVRLEQELRGTKLLMKELESDLMAERASKKLLKEMIVSAKEEIEKFKSGGQIMASIANKIERHLNLSETQSRELFSGYRAAKGQPKSALVD